MSKSLALLFRASLSVAFLLTATCIAHAQKTEASASIGPFSSEIEDEGLIGVRYLEFTIEIFGEPFTTRGAGASVTVSPGPSAAEISSISGISYGSLENMSNYAITLNVMLSIAGSVDVGHSSGSATATVNLDGVTALATKTGIGTDTDSSQVTFQLVNLQPGQTQSKSGSFSIDANSGY